MSSSASAPTTVSGVAVLAGVAPAAAVRPRSRQLVVLFGATLFLSACLMFMAEPMIARLVLPRLGGAAAVWNTCLVFFQAVLLCGYAYAHGATTWLGTRRHTVVHVLVLLLPWLVLPIGLRYAGPPPSQNPVG